MLHKRVMAAPEANSALCIWTWWLFYANQWWAGLQGTKAADPPCSKNPKPLGTFTNPKVQLNPVTFTKSTNHLKPWEWELWAINRTESSQLIRFGWNKKYNSDEANSINLIRDQTGVSLPSVENEEHKLPALPQT